MSKKPQPNKFESKIHSSPPSKTATLPQSVQNTDDIVRGFEDDVPIDTEKETGAGGYFFIKSTQSSSTNKSPAKTEELNRA